MNINNIRRILIISLLFAGINLFAQTLPFKDGEHMTYVVHYKWGINADLAQLDLSCKAVNDGERNLYHVVGNISTFKSWDGFYKIRDIYECKFTADADMLPVSYHRQAREGKKYSADNWYDWSPDAMSAKVKIIKSTRAPVDTVYNEGMVIRDLLNIIYKYRVKELKEGYKEKETFVIDRDILDAQIRVIGKERIKTKELGYVNTIKVGIAVLPRKVFKNEKHDGVALGVKSEDGTFFGDEKVFIWYSDDKNHVPVMFKAPLKVGSFNGRLSYYEGGMYPFTSMIDGKAN